MHEKMQINCLENLVGGLNLGTFLVYMWGVSSVKVEPKSNWLQILVILTVFLVVM